MKKLRSLIVLVGVGSACQQHVPSTNAASGPTAVGPAVTHLSPKLNKPATASEKTGMSSDSGAVLTTSLASSNSLLRHDLSALWQGKYDEQVSQVGPMDGFFGRDYRRIAFAFTEIHRDSLRPNVYWVKGKNRFQKTVSPFNGTINIKSIAHLKSGVTREEAGILDVEDLNKVFTVKATFEFREQPASNTTGIFTGTGYLDFFIDSAGEIHSAISMMDVSPALPAKGAGVLYNGQWVGYGAGTGKPLLISGNVFLTAPMALAHFGIGDRDPSFNPEYAKLGWNDYWANDEWWADSPKPSLSLQISHP